MEMYFAKIMVSIVKIDLFLVVMSERILGEKCCNFLFLLVLSIMVQFRCTTEYVCFM